MGDSQRDLMVVPCFCAYGGDTMSDSLLGVSITWYVKRVLNFSPSSLHFFWACFARYYY